MIEKQEDMKTKEDVLEYVKAHIYYRGGMSNRIDAWDIQKILEGKEKRYFKQIMRCWNTRKKTESGKK